MRRSKLRFTLLTAAVSLLVFLVLLLSTLSGALISALIGAVEGLSAQGLVYTDTARDNIAASRLEPTAVEAVAKIPGVAEASGIGTFTTTTEVGGETLDLQIFGFTPDAPGAPTGLSDGRLPSAMGEVAVDGTSLEIGDEATLLGIPVTVVGLLNGAQLNALPTAYMTIADYEAIVTAANPGLPFVPLNAVAFNVDAGADPAAVADAITAGNSGLVGYTLESAVAKIPGIESITQSFGILVGLTFVIAIVVIGFFFLILTVQKMRVFTLLRAVGATAPSLSGAVALQIGVVVVIASVVAVGLTLLSLVGLSTGIPVRLNASLIVGTVVAVLVFSLLAGLLSIRRIARIDPASAVGAR